MKFQHQELASGKWFKLSTIEQLANIGSEVERTISWRKKNNLPYSQMAFERCLELLYLTIEDKKNRMRLGELIRVKEMLLDYFMSDNKYHSNDKNWQKYFYEFTYASRLKK